MNATATTYVTTLNNSANPLQRSIADAYTLMDQLRWTCIGEEDALFQTVHDLLGGIQRIIGADRFLLVTKPILEWVIQVRENLVGKEQPAFRVPSNGRGPSKRERQAAAMTERLLAELGHLSERTVIDHFIRAMTVVLEHYQAIFVP